MYSTDYSTLRSAYRKKGRSRRTGTNSQTDKCLAVYRNPFSNSTTSPKIPDGKFLLSSGLRLQCREEMINDTTTEMIVMVYPGLGSGAYMTSGTTAAGAVSKIFSYQSHGDFDTFVPIADDGTNAEIPALQALATMKVKEVAKWRLVSQGIRLSLLNTSEANDGWWESIRVPTEESRVLSLFGGAPAASGPMFANYPSTYIANMINSPTYRSGKLRDLHKQTFVLKPHAGDHDPKQCTGTFTQTGTETYTDQTTQLLDSDFDSLLIRINGRASATGVIPTRLLCHLVSNQEVVYNDRSHLARYHSEGLTSKKLPYVKRAVTANTASTTRRMV